MAMASNPSLHVLQNFIFLGLIVYNTCHNQPHITHLVASGRPPKFRSKKRLLHQRRTVSGLIVKLGTYPPYNVYAYPLIERCPDASRIVIVRSSRQKLPQLYPRRRPNIRLHSQALPTPNYKLFPNTHIGFPKVFHFFANKLSRTHLGRRSSSHTHTRCHIILFLWVMTKRWVQLASCEAS